MAWTIGGAAVIPELAAAILRARILIEHFSVLFEKPLDGILLGQPLA